MQEISHRILDEVKKTVIGKDAVVRKVYMAILAGGHILLEDIPGVGKTTLAMAFAGRSRHRLFYSSMCAPYTNKRVRTARDREGLTRN